MNPFRMVLLFIVLTSSRSCVILNAIFIDDRCYRHQRFGVEFVLSIHNKPKIHMFGGMVLRTVGQTEKIDLHFLVNQS